MNNQPKNYVVFPQLALFDICWRGKNVFSLPTKTLWKIVGDLQQEGLRSTSYDMDSQFPMFEASPLDVITSVALYVSFQRGEHIRHFQSNHEFQAIVKNYQNTDLRLLKHSLN